MFIEYPYCGLPFSRKINHNKKGNCILLPKYCYIETREFTLTMSTGDTFSKGAAEAIIGFLKSNIKTSAIQDVEAELKKDFVLAKKRGNVVKKKKSKKKSHGLTRRQKDQLGFFSIPRDSLKYKHCLRLHEMWLCYMSQLVDLDRPLPGVASKAWENFTQTIYKADFHGSMLKVVRSKCSSFVGKAGICIMDTRNTFKILSENNIITTLPKRENVFEMYLKNHKVTLFGKHLCVRPAERSTKKIKGHIHPDL